MHIQEFRLLILQGLAAKKFEVDYVHFEPLLDESKDTSDGIYLPTFLAR
ncbi:hypothetical protein [Adhaeretor mobilis]|nr:hypothetical protein [Adhaeretor mobilis]